MRKYSVLYVDPPWEYESKHTGGNLTRATSAKKRGDEEAYERYREGASGAEQQYPTLSMDDLLALPMENVAAENCVLALWDVVPLHGAGHWLIDRWGFEFKTTYHWIKTGRIGMGHWFRGNVEYLHFAIRGDVKPFRMNTERNHKELPATEHSEKPHWFRQLVERSTRHVVDGPRLEIFARERVPGWNSTGFDLDGHDIRAVLAEPDKYLPEPVLPTLQDSVALF